MLMRRGKATLPLFSIRSHSHPRPREGRLELVIPSSFWPSYWSLNVTWDPLYCSFCLPLFIETVHVAKSIDVLQARSALTLASPHIASRDLHFILYRFVVSAAFFPQLLSVLRQFYGDRLLWVSMFHFLE